MQKQLFALLVAASLTVMATAGVSDPVISGDKHVAWLGEENYLYLEDETGSIKRLPTPIRDLLSLTEKSVYCLSADGRLFDIHLDGSTGTIVSANPAAEDIEKYRTKPAFTLEEGVLSLALENGGQERISLRAVAASQGAGVLYWVERTASGSYLLQSRELPSKTQLLSLSPVAVLKDISVSEPISISVSHEAVTLVTKDHAVEAVSLANHSVTRLEAISQQTAAAIYCDGKLMRFTQQEKGWELESVAAVVLGAVQSTSAHSAYTQAPATVTPRPTAVPTAAATRTPAATKAPSTTNATSSTSSSQDDGSIRPGNRGSAVRKMQQRLSSLGYPVGKVDGVFGDKTLYGVHLFQNAIHVKERNYMTQSMLNSLYAATAPVYDPCMPLRKGDKGLSVQLMQTALKERGYNPGKIDGSYGKNTVSAVAAFQTAVGIPLKYGEVIGEQASHELLEVLYNTNNFTPWYPSVTAPPAVITAPPYVITTQSPVHTVPPVVIYPATWTDLNTAPVYYFTPAPMITQPIMTPPVVINTTPEPVIPPVPVQTPLVTMPPFAPPTMPVASPSDLS